MSALWAWFCRRSTAAQMLLASLVWSAAVMGSATIFVLVKG